MGPPRVCCWPSYGLLTGHWGTVCVWVSERPGGLWRRASGTSGRHEVALGDSAPSLGRGSLISPITLRCCIGFLWLLGRITSRNSFSHSSGDQKSESVSVGRAVLALEVLGESPFFASSSSWHFLICGHITPISAFLVPLPPCLLSMSSLPPPHS